MELWEEKGALAKAPASQTARTLCSWQHLLFRLLTQDHIPATEAPVGMLKWEGMLLEAELLQTSPFSAGHLQCSGSLRETLFTTKAPSLPSCATL